MLRIGNARGRWVICCACAFAAGSAGFARAALELTSAASATILSTGPRSGENGTRYFNVQGKANERYASFGVLDFPAPAGDPPTSKLKGLTLSLVQSIPQFARDGKIKFYLAVDAKTVNEPADALRFDATAADGVGDQFKSRLALGAGEFKKVKTGNSDSFTFTVDASGQEFVDGQLKKGGKVRVIVVPDGADVAATYFGSGAPEPANRPKLILDFAR